MKHLKTVEVPARTHQVVDKITCDFCGSVLQSESNFDFTEVTLLHNQGTRYPGKTNSTKTAFDCCDACWTNKVLPALRALGGTPSVEDYEFEI